MKISQGDFLLKEKDIIFKGDDMVLDFEIICKDLFCNPTAIGCKVLMILGYEIVVHQDSENIIIRDKENPNIRYIYDGYNISSDEV